MKAFHMNGAVLLLLNKRDEYAHICVVDDDYHAVNDAGFPFFAARESNSSDTPTKCGLWLSIVDLRMDLLSITRSMTLIWYI